MVVEELVATAVEVVAVALMLLEEARQLVRVNRLLPQKGVLRQDEALAGRCGHLNASILRVARTQQPSRHTGRQQDFVGL